MRKIRYHYKSHFPWAMKALKRDYYKCVECGSDNYIIVHHKDKNRMNNNPDNLITLCKPCHAEAHHQTMRWTNPNIDIINELRNQGKTYDFIGKHLGVSRQRIHQIVKKTLS